MNPYETLTPEKDSGPLLSRLHRLYGLHGYRPFRVSRFEKYELYAACKDFLVSDRVLTFTDTDGELLALKPDVTLSILRAVPYHPGIRQRLFYHESVYRPGPPDGRFREMPQSGVECIGDLDDFDVYEILRLADDCLRLLPCETALSFSHLGILRSLLNLLPADENDRGEILRLLSSRSVHGLSELFRCSTHCTRCWGWNVPSPNCRTGCALWPGTGLRIPCFRSWMSWLLSLKGMTAARALTSRCSMTRTIITVWSSAAMPGVLQTRSFPADAMTAWFGVWAVRAAPSALRSTLALYRRRHQRPAARMPM